MVNSRSTQGTYLSAIKSADETENSDSTVNSDSDLVLALKANTNYAFILRAKVNSGTTPDFKFTFASITSATGEYQLGTVSSSTIAGDTAFATDTTIQTTGNNESITIFGSVIMGASAGNLQFQWAQGTSNAGDTKLLKGSYLLVWEL